jgi:hypothetical protein
MSKIKIKIRKYFKIFWVFFHNFFFFEFLFIEDLFISRNNIFSVQHLISFQKSLKRNSNVTKIKKI